YVNGSLVGSPTSVSGGMVVSNEELNIGRDPANPTRFYHGLIDEVEFFNRAVSASEIQAIYAAGSAGKCRPTATPTPTRTNTPVPPTSTPTPSANGIVFVRPQPETGADSNIWIMNTDGSNQTQLTNWNGDDRWPALSPNGSKIAYISIRNNQQTFWVMNSNGTNATQLPVGGNTQRLDWSPNNQQIAYTNDSQDWWEV